MLRSTSQDSKPCGYGLVPYMLSRTLLSPISIYEAMFAQGYGAVLSDVDFTAVRVAVVVVVLVIRGLIFFLPLGVTSEFVAKTSQFEPFVGINFHNSFPFGSCFISWICSTTGHSSPSLPFPSVTSAQ